MLPQSLLFSWWHLFSNRMQLTSLKRKEMKNKKNAQTLESLLCFFFFKAYKKNYEQNSIAAKLLLSPTGSGCACDCNNETLLTPYTMSL